MKSLYIHVQNKSWKVRIEEGQFDKEVDRIARILSESLISERLGSVWIPVYTDPHTADANIHLTMQLKKFAILETVVE